MINLLTAPTPITFTDDDIPRGFDCFHTHPLYTTIFMSGYEIRRVMVDNGASLNICPLKTILRVRLSQTDLEVSNISIATYDGAQRKTLGIIPLTLKIELVVQIVRFYIIVIEPSFNLLIGKPWLHENLVVASTLH
ncbi:hypothetical protein AMTRI_Chr03g46140 [Amborella trichopoda]